MFRLGRLTDYAVTLLSHMGSGEIGVVWAAPDLAEISGLPMPTASKILKRLAKGQLITAQRGASGGYRLARPASEITIAQIIESMDGPIAITDCSDGSLRDGCKIQSLCPMSNGWNKVNVAMRKALSSVSLSEMVAGPR